MAVVIRNSNWAAQRREHERSLARAVFSEPEKLARLGTVVRDGSFNDLFYQAIFNHSVVLYNAGQFNHPRLKQRLRSSGFLSDEREMSEFAELRRELSTESEWHAAELNRMYVLEQMYVLLANSHERVQDLGADPAAIVASLTARLEALDARQTALWETGGDVMRRIYAKHREHANDPNGGMLGITTGMSELDKYTGGYFKQQLWQVAARSYYGKTTFALNMVSNLVRRERPVGVYFASYEMSNDELGERLLADLAAVSLAKFTQGTVDANDLCELIGAVEEYRESRLLFDEKPPETVAGLKARVKLAIQEFGIEVLVVDHLHQIPVPKGAKKHEHLSGLVTDFKRMAKELEIVVIVLNQLNTKAIEDGEPTNMHFAEGKGVIIPLDVSLLLHRKDESAELMKVIISKNKKGPKAHFYMHFDGEFQRVSATTETMD